MTPSPSALITFWRDAGPERWFAKDEAFDAAIRERWLDAHHAAAGGALEDWDATADGALALVLLLDQIPRNLFRHSAHAFATDAAAREVTRRALAQDFDAQIDIPLRPFFYLPLMHSEHLADQDHCVGLYQRLGDGVLLGFATAHRAIIARFGRFPHRNGVMRRQTTADEQAFLDAGGFAG